MSKVVVIEQPESSTATDVVKKSLREMPNNCVAAIVLYVTEGGELSMNWSGLDSTCTWAASVFLNRVTRIDP